jgi:hypothetical protein
MIEKIKRQLARLEELMDMREDVQEIRIQIMYVEGIDGRPGKVTPGEVIHVRCPARAAKKNGGDKQ